MKRHDLAGLLALALLLAPVAARAEAPATIRIGVLNDMSGPYADLSGKGSVVAAQMAADDFAHEAGPAAPKVEILSADHQNKPDIGAAIVRAWVDQNDVAAVVDVPIPPSLSRSTGSCATRIAPSLPPAPPPRT